MVTIRAHFDGRVFVPDEPVSLPAGRALEIIVTDLQPWPKGSPAALLQAMSQMPRLNRNDVAALEESIEAGKLPVRDAGIFDEPIA